MREFDSNYITTVGSGVPDTATTIKIPTQPTGLAASTVTNNITQDKITLLEDKIQEKVAALASGGISAVENKVDRSTIGMNPNKVNYMTPEQLQEEFGSAVTYAILDRPDGSKYQFRRNPDGTYARDAKGEWIEDTVSANTPKENLYVDTTREGNYKLGIAGSDVNPNIMSPFTGKPVSPAEARYMDKRSVNPYMYEYKPKEGEIDPLTGGPAKGYNGTPGPRGVTPEDGFLLDVTLPKALAQAVEYDTHTNIGQLASRAAGQGSVPKETKNAFGAGYTEYTTPDAPLWNQNYNISKAKVAADTVLPKEVSLVKQAISTGKGLTLEDINRMIDKDSTVGEMVDTAQASLMKQWAGSVNALNKVVRAAGSGLGIEQGTIDKYVPEDVKIEMLGDGKYTAKEYLKDGMADKIAGVKPETRAAQAALMKGAEKDVASGNYVDATVKILQAMPTTLGDSAGEIAALTLRTPGLLTAVANRVSNDADTYKENNGKEPDAAWLATSVGTNTIALATEKLLLKSGISGALKKGVGATGRAGAVAGSMAGETGQEWYDQTQQEYMTQKEDQRTLEDIATSPSAVVAAMSGGLMGGVLKGSAETASAIKDALSKPTKLTPEQEEVLNRPEETTTVRGEEVTTGLTEDDIVNAKDIYNNAKAGGSLMDARNLAEAVDQLETGNVKSDKDFKLHEAGADRREALQAILRDSWGKATYGKNMNDETESDEAAAAFKEIIKSYGLSSRNRKEMNQMLTQGLMYGTEGFGDAAGAFQAGLKSVFGGGLGKAAEDETLGMKDEVPAEKTALANPFGNMQNMFGGFGKDNTKEEKAELDQLVKTKADTRTIVEKKVEQQVKKKSSKPTDEALGVGITVEDGYVKGVSARTLNKLADMFDLEVRDVRDSLEFAIPVMSVKKMDAVSKQAAKVQYDTYYGTDGILPSYTGFKKAIANGEVDKAVEYINKIREAGTRLDRELIKHTRAAEEIGKLVDSVLTKVESGKMTEAKAAMALDSLDTTVGKRYTLNAMDVAKDRIPESIQALMDKRKESKVPEVVKAKQEALAMVDGILAHESITRDKPVYEKSYVADRIKDFEARIAETKKSIDEQKLEIDSAETREDKVVGKKLLTKLEKTLKEQEDALNTYNTKYADVEYTWKEVFNRDKNKTKAEVEPKSGEQVGKVTEAQAKEMEAKGREVKPEQVAEKRNVTAVGDIKGKVEELTRLRKELDDIKEKSNGKYDEVKAKIKEVQDKLEDTSFEKIQNKVDKLYKDLDEYKAKKRKITSELRKAEKLEQELGERNLELAKAYIDTESKDASVSAIKRGLLKALDLAGTGIKITMMKVRRLIGGKSTEELKAELADITARIEDKKAELDSAIKRGTTIVKAKTGVKSAEAKKVVTAKREIKRLKTMVGMSIGNGPTANKVLDARDRNVKKVWDKIKEIETSLYGTRLVAEGRNKGKGEIVNRQLPKGESVDVNVDLGSTLKFRPTLFGHVNMIDLAELIADKDAYDTYVTMVDNAANKMEQAIGARDNDFTIADSPAMYFLRDSRGKIDKQVAGVVALAANEWIATTAKASLSNSRDTIARMVGKLDGSQVTRKEAALFRKGRLLVNEATSVGGNILNALGIQEGSMPRGQYAQLKADFGNYAMSYLEKSGGITIEPINHSKWNEVFKEKQLDKDAKVYMVYGVKDKTSRYEKVKKDVQAINEALDLQDFAKNYRTTPIRTEGKVYQIENGYSQAPEHNQEVLRKLEQQKWRVAIEAADELLSMKKDDIKRLMGWIDLDTMNPEGGEITHTKEAKDAQESVNREIENNLDAVMDMIEKTNKKIIGRDTFFEWFFAKNGRYMMDSVGVNPQVDKQLARFLIVPKEATEVTWDLNDKKDRLYFMSGIIQGLGIDLDNKSTAELKLIGEKLLALTPKQVEDMAAELKSKGKYITGNGVEVKAAHLGHTLQAIAALKQPRVNGKVKATVTMEFDSKTSGFFHKLMQLPFEDKKDQVKWLEKTGAYAYYSEDPVKGVGTNDKMTTVEDAYRTLTIESDNALKKNFKKKPELADKYNALVNAGVVPELIKDGKVTKEGRELNKYPFMRFNYAESIQSNRKSMALDLVGQALDKVVAGKVPYNEDSKAFYTMIGIKTEAEANKLREDLAKKDIGDIWIDKKNLEKTMSEVFNSIYGEALEEVMTNNFGHILEANKLMIAATQIMADTFIAELEGIDVTMLTQEELDAQIEKYIKVFPQIRAPFTESRENGMTIIDTERADAGNKWKADTRLDENSKYKTRTVQALIQAFTKAKAAGAVIPTHWTDGAVIGEVLKQGGVLGIHDAIALGFKGDQIEQMVKDMNRASYEVNRDFNIMQNIYTALIESLESASDEAVNRVRENAYNKASKDDDGMLVQDVVEALREATNMYNKRRADMYGREMAVGNIIAYEDTVYRSNEKSKAKLEDMAGQEAKMKDIQEAVAEEIKKCRGGK